jgi:hypothetical protein
MLFSDFKLKKSELTLKKSELTLKKSELTLKKSELTLKKSELRHLHPLIMVVTDSRKVLKYLKY